jgi:phosphoglycerol transferase MdoB-like AlkP superfamily enzyme
MNDSNLSNRILWIKALWNSILALLIGFVVYMFPGLIVGFKMGFELGPKTKNNPEVSAQISKTISEMYQENILFIIGSIIITGLAILWRSRIVSRGTGDKKLINGFLVGFFPLFIGLLYIGMRGFNIIAVVGIVLFIGLGLLGSMLHEKSS